MSSRLGPTRAQKRWSGRLRTLGALLSLLGTVALADRVLDLAAPTSPLSPTGRGAEWPAWAGVLFLAVGGLAYALGRRWR